MEKHIKKNIYIYELNHLAVHQKVTQHCKPATILEKDTEDNEMETYVHGLEN